MSKLIKIFKICVEVLVPKFTCAEVRLPVRTPDEDGRIALRDPWSRWWIHMHRRTIYFLPSNWFLFFPILYPYNTYCLDQANFQFYVLIPLSDNQFGWTTFFSKISLSWIPFWISSNFGYEQTTMIRLSFGIVTLIVIAIQLGFRKMLPARTLIGL